MQADTDDDFSLVWSESYEIGIPDIDADHRGIFSAFNKFSEAIKSGLTDQDAKDAFGVLFWYTVNHFNSEEHILKRSGYPDFEAHRREHYGFEVKLYSIRAMFSDGNDIRDELYTFFKEWLLAHILGTDRKFGAYLKTLG